MHLVSVLLPVHNGGRFLDEALRSVLGQTHRRLEVIAVDDGSTDGSLAVLRAWAHRDERVRVLVNGAAGGVAAALNQALERAQGPLVARMDADDVCHPRRLERQLALLAARPEVGACGTGITHVDGRGRPLPSLLTTVPQGPRGVRICAAISTPVFHPTVVMRTDLLRERGGYDERAVLEDLDLWLRCADVDMVNLPEPLLRYRVHGANTTGRARVQGRAQLVAPLQVHLDAVLGLPVPLEVCRLLLDPAAAAAAEDEHVAAVLGLLDHLCSLEVEDRAAVLDRSLSTVARMALGLGRAGRRLPALHGRRFLRTSPVVRRLARGAYVGARRAVASRPSVSR